MVVRAQCSRLLSYYTLSRFDVLFFTKGGKPAGVFVQTFDHSLLGVDLFIHLGRTSSFVVHSIAQLGTIAWYCIFLHAHLPKLGRYDQWFADIAWRMG